MGRGQMPSRGGQAPVDLEGALGPYIPALRRFARGLLRDADAADDLVQDCLTRAISRWHLRRENGALRPWLFTILYNLFVSDRRAAGRRGGPAMRVEDWDKMLPSVDGRRLAEDRLVWRDVMIGLDSLPAEQRAVVLLVGVEDLSYEEAAQVIGVPLGTVMSRLSRARERLRRHLEGEAEPDETHRSSCERMT
jgi:RNA polymerase sigma-70 factor, ECF subfamily